MSTIKKIFTITIVLILLIGAVAISSLNADSVNLNLYWYQVTLPMGFMLLVFASLGLLFGLVLSWLLWTWPANKQKTYWERAYFNLKQNNDEVKAKSDQLPNDNQQLDNKQSVVKIP